MSRIIFIGCALLMAAHLAPAAQIVDFGWEDGTSTVLGLFGAGTPPIVATNVAAPDPVHGGVRSLRLDDNDPSGTPEGYLVWVRDLVDGDIVGASFWRYDLTPGSPGAPSARIWAHWNDNPADLYGYNGSASGNSDYGPGTGWDQTAMSWTVADGHTGLVIVVRTYSSPGDVVWIDDLQVTAPDHATVVAVPEPATMLLFALGAAGVFACRRRRVGNRK